MTTPNYVRLDRQTFPDLYTSGMDFSKGLAVLREGRTQLILATAAWCTPRFALPMP